MHKEGQCDDQGEKEQVKRMESSFKDFIHGLPFLICGEMTTKKNGGSNVKENKYFAFSPPPPYLLRNDVYVHSILIKCSFN